jgi:hypothetical protein
MPDPRFLYHVRDPSLVGCYAMFRDVSKICGKSNFKILETNLHSLTHKKTSFFRTKNVYLADISGFVSTLTSTQFVECL